MAIPTFAGTPTIIGPGCLTTVFGMGTGVTTTVWSPKKYVPLVSTTHLDDLVNCKSDLNAEFGMRIAEYLATIRNTQQRNSQLLHSIDLFEHVA